MEENHEGAPTKGLEDCEGPKKGLEICEGGPKRGFGGFTKHFWATSVPQKSHNRLQWVNRRYMPIDLRDTVGVPTMGVQAHKFENSHRYPPMVPPCWIPRHEVPPQRRYSQVTAQGNQMCPSSPATRSEEWSSLREMLPSKGLYIRNRAPNWGTSGELALPTITQERPYEYPKIKSMMTR